MPKIYEINQEFRASLMRLHDMLAGEDIESTLGLEFDMGVHYDSGTYGKYKYGGRRAGPVGVYERSVAKRDPSERGWGGYIARVFGIKIGSAAYDWLFTALWANSRFPTQWDCAARIKAYVDADGDFRRMYKCATGHVLAMLNSNEYRFDSLLASAVEARVKQMELDRKTG